MGLPMTPSPMNPIVSAKDALLVEVAPDISRPARSGLRAMSETAIISHMKRIILAAALIGVAVSPLAAGGKGSLTGSYVEARTAEVFTGGCIMNSDAATV